MLKLMRKGCLLVESVLGGSILLCSALKNVVWVQNALQCRGWWEWLLNTDSVVCPVSQFLCLHSLTLEVF